MRLQAYPADHGRFDMPLVTSAPPDRPAPIQTRQDDLSVSAQPADDRPADGVETAGGLDADTGNETDVDDLVDRVLRKLMRRLAVESERRGWRQWP